MELLPIKEKSRLKYRVPYKHVESYIKPHRDILYPAQLRYNPLRKVPTLVLEPALPLVAHPQNGGGRGAGTSLLYHGCNAPEVEKFFREDDLWC